MGKYRYRYTDVPSVIQGDIPDGEEVCAVCGRYMRCDFHHILNSSRKEFSEREGFWVWLCREDHKKIHETNQGKVRWDRWKRICQEKYELSHERAEWMRKAHRNYR